MKILQKGFVVLTTAIVVLGSPVVAHSDETAVEEHLKAGRAAFEDGLYKVADRELEHCLKEAAATDADIALSSEAVVLLARSRIQQGRSDELLDFLRQKSRWIKKAAPGTGAFWRSLAIYEIGDSTRTLETLAQFETRHPDSEYLPRVIRLRAWSHLDLGQQVAALDAFERYQREFPNGDEAQQNLLDWAKTLIAGERPADAILVLAQIPTNAPAGITAQTRLWTARIHLKERRWEDAASTLAGISEAAPIDPDLRAETWFSLADAHLGTNGQHAAAEALARGLAFARKKELVLDGKRRLGILQLGVGDVTNGVALLKACVTEAPADHMADVIQLKLSGALLNAGKAEDALKEYQYYVETFTNAMGVAEAQRGRGWALLALKRYSEAAMAFEKACERFADADARQECIYKAGDAFFLNEQYKQASAKYRLFIQEYPGAELVPSASFQLAESQSRAGELESAESLFVELAEKFPGHALAEEALLRVGDIRRDSGRLVGAAESYTRVMQTYSNGAYFADAMLGRGLARYKLYRFAEALEDFERVAERTGKRDAQSIETRYWIAMCHYWLGNPDRAESLAKAFLEEHADSPLAARVAFWLGKQAFNNGKHEEAEERFLKFYEENGDHEDTEAALLWAGRSAAARKDYLRANELFRNLLEAHTDSPFVPDARYEQGNAMVALAEYPEAILVFQEIVNKHPDYDQLAETWLRIGDSQFNLGAGDEERYETAIKAYHAAAEHPDAGVDLKLHAEYKVGRCLEKLERTDEAVAHYYTRVMIRFLEDRERGVTHNEASRMWFGRACRNIAGLLEAEGEIRKLVSVLERALNVGVPDEAAIRERIKKLRAEHWWLFY